MVKKSSKPIPEVIDTFFEGVSWSPLLEEWNRFSAAEKRLLVAKLECERKRK
jgi:hypothetical protein